PRPVVIMSPLMLKLVSTTENWVAALSLLNSAVSDGPGTPLDQFIGSLQLESTSVWAPVQTVVMAGSVRSSSASSVNRSRGDRHPRPGGGRPSQRWPHGFNHMIRLLSSLRHPAPSGERDGEERAVCDIRTRPSAPARRPSAGAMPGR